MSAANGRLALTTRVELDEEVLTVAFRAESRCDDPLYVYLHPDDGRRSQLLPGAFVCVGGTSELHLLLAPPPAPTHFALQRAVIPLARLLDPGEVHEGRIELELPLVEWSPYLAAEVPENLPEAAVDRGWLRVGFFEADTAGWVEAGPEPGTVWTEGFDMAMAEARFELPRSVPARLRPDFGPRF